MLESSGTVLVPDLVSRLNVSEMTIRRDLAALERKGLLRRVYGGAVSSRGRSYEPPFILRSAAHIEEKKRIGKAAAELIHNGDSVMLDVGTTTLEVAHHLADHHNLTIITPCFQIANMLVEHPGIRLILTGGILRPVELSMVGHLAEHAIREFYVDKLFLAAGGIDLKAGLTEFNMEDALVKQAMLLSAKDVTLVADSSKFGQVAFAAIAPLKAVNRIITDRNLSHVLAQGIEKLDIELLLV
jgi:DeoR/GlpR family transcriptional regulator of sugar metabolism